MTACLLCAQYDRDPVVCAPDRVCGYCALRVAGDLADIGRRWPRLGEELERGSASGGERVSGGTESTEPLRLAVVDLTLPASQGHISAALRGALGDPDQIGALPVATELDFWVRDWRLERDRGEGLPVPTVPALIAWLSGERLAWALRYSLAIDEFAACMARLSATMRAVEGDVPAPPQRCEGVECWRCQAVGSLYRVPGEDRVECGRCSARRTGDEYNAWVRLLAANAREAA